ncbi:zinc finger and BTB domain-containing protein 41-like isoform X8 [Cydia pomonella]|uniref:zinc finger and BTB domain-containing protein 41-like isoform X8 n=1 Tax=Cydia pomonella TaxID=82600 RepID=UPI002ADE3750|nr:zinc finger and BTB domain-containing protein 41-like isoform X8 [Cydia pomonella]
MDFDEIVVKESPGLCRCCLSEGCYKDLGSEYSWMSETEIYADMLLECFDISISQHPTGPNGSNRLICEVCITRLRDACNFKKQVLESEKKFVDMVGRGEFRPKVLLYQTQMKTEHIMELEEETGADDSGEVEYLEEDTDFVDEDLLKNEDYGEASVSEDITVSTLAVKGKRGRPKKTAAKPEKKAKVAKTEEKPKKAVAKDGKPKDKKHQKTALRRYKLSLIRRNVHLILEYGNVMPFMWARSTYLCFYCKQPAKDPDELRDHIEAMHQFLDLDQILSMRISTTWDSEVPVKLDVKDISCKLCIQPISDLQGLIDHLIQVHEADYDTSINDCLFSFELGNEKVTCPICNIQFNYFEYLLRHANKHHLNHDFTCNVCGKSFHRKNALATHFNDYHKEGGYPCDICGVVCTTAARRYNHKKNYHLIDHLKCPYCPEISKSKYYKNLHLATVHGVEKCRSECPHCQKLFPQKGIMLAHVRRVHYKERNVECEICSYKFFNKAHLDAHMVKHTGGQMYTCDVCGKAYLRKSTLKAHLKRHVGGRVKV